MCVGKPIPASTKKIKFSVDKKNIPVVSHYYEIRMRFLKKDKITK